MKKQFLLLVFTILLANACLYAQTYDFDFSQTPYLYMNLKFLDTKFGGQYHGFGLGLEPVVNVNNRLRVSFCYDFPYIDGKYKSMNESRNSKNELKKFYKLGGGVDVGFIKWSDLSDESVTLKKENIGWGWFRRYYENVMVERQHQISFRGGLERFRYILELNKYNAQLKESDNSPYIRIDNRNLSEYDAVANWNLSTFYAGLSYSRLFSSHVEVSKASADFNEILTIYADYILPLTANIDLLTLGASEYDLNPVVKKSNWGFKIGAMRITEGFVKIEAGYMPGVKSGHYIDMSLGYPLKLLKRKKH
jgi:hypothetical protein